MHIHENKIRTFKLATNSIMIIAFRFYIVPNLISRDHLVNGKNYFAIIQR